MSRRSDQGAGNSNPDRPSLLVGSAHLAALWALAFAEPLFDLLGRNPDFFVARANSAADIVAFALIFSLLPPLAMLAVEAAASRFDRGLGWAIHIGLVALLCAAIVLQVLKHLADGPAGVLIALAIGFGCLLAAGYARTHFLRSVADVLTPAPLVVLVVFLFFSDASKLVLPQSEAKASQIQINSRTPVVEVVFDEFPEGTIMNRGGRIDVSRFPAFADLAAHSTWYRGATTVAGFTPRAVPAILTGRLPDDQALPISSDQPHSVFTLLGGTYRMQSMENATQICPKSLCGDQGRSSAEGGLGSLLSDLRVVSEHLLLPDGIAAHLPAVDQTFGDFASSANDQPARLRNAANPDRLAVAFGQTTGDESDRMAAFEARLRGGRTLNLIHVEKPHYPWNHFPDGRKFSNLTGELSDVFTEDGRWNGPRSLTDLALQRHMLETGFTDHLLGTLIAKLRASGLWERAIVVVTADHGGAVIAHDKRRNPTQTNLGQIAPVPLFIKAPGRQQGKVVDRHVCTTGILPTVARMLRIDYPWHQWRCPAGVVRVANSPSGSTSLPFEVVERLRDAYVARISRLFGSGDGWGPVLRFTPNQQLIGHRTGTIRGLPVGDGSASLDDPGLLREVNPQAPVVLASLLRGTLDGVDAGQPLAAAVNGRIAAVGRSFSASDGMRFSLLVPPARLREGANRVDIYRVAGRGSRLRLQRLGP